MTIKGIKKPAKKRAKNQAISTPCTETDVKNHSTTRPDASQETIAHPALIPVGKSCWWAGVKSGRFPQPVKLGPRVTAWRVEDVRDLIAKA